MRHGTRSRSGRDEPANLTDYGRRETRELAARLKTLDIAPKHYFTGSYRHARETAEILARVEGDRSPKIVEVEALTPRTPNNLFTIEKMITHASDNGVHLDNGDMVALIGHEPRLSQLITRMTGERFRPLDRLDAVCVTGRNINQLRLGRGEVAWRVPVKAFQEEKLRPKVASKMSVATLLAGFSFAALLQLITEKQLPTIRDLLQESSLVTGLAAVLLWLAAICLTGALGFFIATVYAYDRLGMPEGFWTTGSSNKRNSLPAFVREDRKQHGPIYAHMVHIWSHVFTPGVVLAGIGLLLIAIDAGSIELGVLCAVALGATGFYYRRIRPQLGVD